MWVDDKASCKRTSAFPGSPVTLAAFKLHARIDTAAGDTDLTDILSAATQFCEDRQAAQYLTATYRQRHKWFPDEIKLRRAPVQSVTSIIYLDTAGASQTLATAVYQTNFDAHVVRISEAPNKTWPSTQADAENAVVVTFVAGYGAAVDVPDTVKHAIKLVASHWNENREALLIGSISKELELTVESLLNQGALAFV